MEQKIEHIWEEGIFEQDAKASGYWRTDTCTACTVTREAYKAHEHSPDEEIEIVSYSRGDRTLSGQRIDCWGGPNPV